MFLSGSTGGVQSTPAIELRSTGFISCVGSIIGSVLGASSSIGGNSFTGSSASIVLVISGSTSDIYNNLYIFFLLSIN